MRTPTIEHGVVMPDACPAGNALGTIPVGGAVASRAIHPAFHSADICCSMHVSLFAPGTATATFMEAVQASTRFGPGSRRREHWVPDAITDELASTRNPFLKDLEQRAKSQLADQGDGNHFTYLGYLKVTPRLKRKLIKSGRQELAEALQGHDEVLALVSHHGSRDLGAQVYKRGLDAAVEHTRKVSPDTPPHQVWLDPDSKEGEAYWEALGYVARWTKRNHEMVHERTAARLGIRPLAAFGNEHNFVWKRTDGLFHHGKGATPAWRDEADHPLLGVIPLNMAEPVLLVLGKDNAALGSFAPHGAGRNKSRTQLLRELGLAGLPTAEFLARSRKLLAEQTEGLDIRFFFDRPDVSETPVAYKSAAAVRRQIERFDLAEVIGEIRPLGCLMAGDYDKPWMTKKNRRSDDQADAVQVDVTPSGGRSKGRRR
jgi:RNA-splicing ligase RtcB